MENEHRIEWIDIYLNEVFMSRTISWPQSLQAAVGIHMKADQTGTVTAIVSCNKHDRWMAEIEL